MFMSGKRVLVTGASGGIGRAISLALAAAGAELLLVGRHRERLEAVLAELAGGTHRVVTADIATAEGRAAILAACEGMLDLLVNNAGVNDFALFADQAPERLAQQLEINLVAPILLTRQLLPLIQRRRGQIINVGSAFGQIGYPGFCAYSAGKFGLRGFSQALGRELSGSGVIVSYLAPRATHTEMNCAEVTAMNRELGTATDTPEAVAEALMQLVHRPRPELLMGRPERFFARVNAFLPGLVDRALYRQLPVIRRHALAAVQGRG
ncbi:MAG: short chain dehydrogenase [Haliea sp.]|nr:short chain dehydrogenase [Haliea sp.]MAL95776.1 short chain dehydrogenase [Haliea sp.]|tara:strand:- start:52751 stop:53548 length:798 start_codon:yes stop_codon:yes gene_type:complete